MFYGINDKRVLNYLIIAVLTIITFFWSFFIFHKPVSWELIGWVVIARIVASSFLFKDYSLSWSKVSPRTFLIKSGVYISAFIVYVPFFYGEIPLYLLINELFTYLFAINFLMYGYYLYANKSRTLKNKVVTIYGAGKAGLKLEKEFRDSPYNICCFIDDDALLNGRSIDGIPIILRDKFKSKMEGKKYDLLVIAMPSAPPKRINEVYEELKPYFHTVQILPSLDTILQNKPFSKQLKDISVEDLLARRPKDLDKATIASFVCDKTVLITGAGGSIGSELVRQCIKYGARKLILLDHSEYALYRIEQEIIGSVDFVCVMQSVVDKSLLADTFTKYQPDIVIHAAAYKHVPLVEDNVKEAIINNVLGTKNCIDLAIENGVAKFILVSTDKAVRPTNVMGATKRICELYAQNVESGSTEIVAVRFGNVLGSSGSVIPKFKEQIEKGGPITVTHPEITRYFMLIPEACELVLQAGAIGKGGEIFILDMGDPVKIVDLAKKMIELSGRRDIEITFTGLRPGEKLYEELLINEGDASTQYESIMVAKVTYYDINKLNEDIENLVSLNDINKILMKLKDMVQEFNHNSHNHKSSVNNLERIASGHKAGCFYQIL